MKQCASIVFLFLASVVLTACTVATKSIADRCVLVDLQAEKGKELIPLLDEFAQRNKLVPDKSHPINPRYQRRLDDEIIEEVSYVIGMGKFGAELSVFRYRKTGDEILLVFDEFVEQEVASRYKVRGCLAVPGYGMPEVYR